MEVQTKVSDNPIITVFGSIVENYKIPKATQLNIRNNLESHDLHGTNTARKVSAIGLSFSRSGKKYFQ